MKLIRRGIVQVLPGKMDEYLDLERKHLARALKLGQPMWKRLRCIAGSLDYLYTIVYETEWNSMAEMEAYFERMFADPEMQKITPKWNGLMANHRFEFYIPLPETEK